VRRALSLAFAGALGCALACDGKEGKGPEYPNTGDAWSERCATAVRRSVSCGTIPLEQEVDGVAVCIKSEGCAKGNLRADALAHYMECESNAPCPTSCVESIGASMSPSDAHGALKDACEKIPARCVGQKRGCEAILANHVSRMFSDAILGELKACTATDDCAVLGDCMSRKVSEIGSVMFMCKNATAKKT
jgi:hypothetical protein